MKFIILIYSIFTFITCIYSQRIPNPPLPTTCSNVLVRKDVRNLSDQEWQKFSDVINTMHQRKWLEVLSKIHNNNMREIHNSGFFMPWHRRFLAHFQMLVNTIDPDVVLPYWDWTASWQNPEFDSVLSSNRFGGNGAGNQRCIVNGVQSSWEKSYPQFGCVSRNFAQGNSPGPFWPMQGIGGDFAEMWAPNDALFFLHHAMVDRIWAIWQNQNRNGFSDINSRTVNGGVINSNSQNFFNRNQRSNVKTPNRYFGMKLQAPAINTNLTRMFSTNNAVAEEMNLRKDIRRMTDSEWGDYTEAIRSMHDLGWLEELSKIHNDYAMEVHGCGFLLPWHRRFVNHFQKLINIINPSIVIPYWDWTAEWQNPENDPVLSSSRFGGNGVGQNQCVRDGIEANWNRTYPDFNCMKRGYQQGASPGPFWPMDGIVRLIRNDREFRMFSTNLENGSHGAVHLGIGADFAEMWAPNE
ncbi:hypothetical protein BB561_006475 [Smittium simulii]|uniref:Tyrosinase copper-binding domain-containing protein n=1 Tax=Smittium simulii TaxID=133385 RepID=A0A2T9Y3X3_9FUNG|nr:hypothetical protein BB561_006475 [Smittium simulii]